MSFSIGPTRKLVSVPVQTHCKTMEEEVETGFGPPEGWSDDDVGMLATDPNQWGYGDRTEPRWTAPVDEEIRGKGVSFGDLEPWRDTRSAEYIADLQPGFGLTSRRTIVTFRNGSCTGLRNALKSEARHIGWTELALPC